MGQDRVSISIDQLTVGVTCSQPIVNDVGVLLVGANSRITQQVITGLRERGILSIEVDVRDLALLRGDDRKKVAAKREWTRETAFQAGIPVKNFLVDRHNEPLSEERAARMMSRIKVAKSRFDELNAQLLVERIRSVAGFVDLSDGFAQSIVDDHDQTVGSTNIGDDHDDASERSVRMSVLGMAVAVELGLDGPQTMEVGLAGMLHDVGLHAMSPVYQEPIETLSEADRWEYQKHPLVAAEAIRHSMEISANVQWSIEQVHEQYDGSGYPRGVKGPRIHLYARILNVVDSYLQLTSPTKQRDAIIPHDALGLLLHQAGRGLFDPQVIRAFLNTESLFPLGSFVELTTGAIAKVIRRPLSGYASPIVQTDDGNRIELASAEVQVARPIADPAKDQLRLTQGMMQSIEWNPAHDSLLI